jgi:hypothetical protein
MHPNPGNPGIEQPGQAGARATLAPDLLGKSCVRCSAGVVVAAQRAVLGDGVRVFKRFAWLGADSAKMALSRSTHAAQYPVGA